MGEPGTSIDMQEISDIYYYDIGKESISTAQYRPTIILGSTLISGEVAVPIPAASRFIKGPLMIFKVWISSC